MPAEPISAAIISTLVKTLAGSIFASLGKFLKNKLSKSDAQTQEEKDLVATIFEQFFVDAEVAKALAVLLQGQPLNRDELAYLFEQSGFDARTLPGVPFAEAMAIFEAAFATAATTVVQPSPQQLKQAETAAERRRYLQRLRRLKTPPWVPWYRTFLQVILLFRPLVQVIADTRFPTISLNQHHSAPV